MLKNNNHTLEDLLKDTNGQIELLLKDKYYMIYIQKNYLKRNSINII